MTYLVCDPGRVLASLVRGWEKGIVLMSEVLAQVLIISSNFCYSSENGTYLGILPTPLAQFLQFILNDRTLPIPQKRPITFLRQYTLPLSLLTPLPTLLLKFFNLGNEWFHRFFEFIIVTQD
jgi:hypothetical protein